nr:hypothetical protein [Candidatus Enterousia merdequi]
MKKFCALLMNVSVFAAMPVIAGAAGTYYNGNLYQNSQQRYGYSKGGYYNSYGAGASYGQRAGIVRPTESQKVSSKKSEASSKKQGLVLDVNASHEFANWNFDMKTAGSKLHYDNLRWNVISGEGTYYFGNTTPMEIKVGALYGFQYGETSMVDDDITSEALWEIQEIEVDNQGEYLLRGNPAVSIGSSKGGSQFGFNASIGLTDFFSFGNMKITPSVGYRYFKYKVSTEKNYGAIIDVVNSNSFVNCLEVQPGEIQCSPYIGFTDAAGNVRSYAGFAISDVATSDTEAVVDVNGNHLNVLVNANGGYVILNDAGASQIDVGNTYYYEQSGKTHIYETEWAGPYVGLDMNYAINNNNNLTAGIEFGLPVYNSEGDQPYRIDWEHPTSVEDSGKFGDAYHFGLNTAWTTKLTDNIGLSLGFAYDYYSVSGATATTYYNKEVYQNLLDVYESWNDDGILTEEGELNLLELRELKSAGWKSEADDEIDSIYKSMGIRIGLDIKF